MPRLPNPDGGWLPGAIEFYGYGPDSCECRTPVQTHYRDFAPRIGLAYQISKRPSSGRSYGIFYYNAGALGGNAQSSGVDLLGYSASPSFQLPDGGITPAFDWDSGFPAYAHAPFFSSTLNTGYNTHRAAPGSGWLCRPAIGVEFRPVRKTGI